MPADGSLAINLSLKYSKFIVTLIIILLLGYDLLYKEGGILLLASLELSFLFAGLAGIEWLEPLL